MNIEPIQIEIVCLFCGMALKGPENASYASGDLIKCLECGEQNDYDSVIEVAEEKGLAQVTQDIGDQLKYESKNIFGEQR
ncbi:MAG: hypothetical protein ACLPXB_10535 [Thiobacillaceae bacterium]